MEILIGTNIATFVIAWIVSRMVTRQKMLQQQIELEAKSKTTAMWIDFIKGGKNE